MSILWLFSSTVELSAAFPAGAPDDLCFDISGVGLVEAVRGTMMAIERYRPDRVVFLGTAGAYPASGIEVGDVVIPVGAHLGSGDLVEGRMRPALYLTRRLTTDGELNELLRQASPSARSARVVCTLGITEDEQLADELGESGEVENLEMFSVIAASEGLPVSGLLAVSNIVGPDGGRHWKENYQGCMSSLKEIIEQVSE